MTDRVKVRKYFWGQTIDTGIFCFDVKVIPGLSNNHKDGLGAKIGLNGPHF